MRARRARGPRIAVRLLWAAVAGGLGLVVLGPPVANLPPALWLGLSAALAALAAIFGPAALELLTLT